MDRQPFSQPIFSKSSPAITEEETMSLLMRILTSDGNGSYCCQRWSCDVHNTVGHHRISSFLSSVQMVQPCC